MVRSRFLPLCLLAAGAVLFAACGEEPPADVHADPNRVFDRAMQAVHAGDWNALRPLLTKQARTSLERDLSRLRRRLAHEEDGKQERRIAKARLGADYEAELRAATTGSISDVLRFFVRISPRPAKPKTRSRRYEKFKAEILYQDDEGVLHPVRLVRRPEGWFVDDLQL